MISSSLVQGERKRQAAKAPKRKVYTVDVEIDGKRYEFDLEADSQPSEADVMGVVNEYAGKVRKGTSTFASAKAGGSGAPPEKKVAAVKDSIPFLKPQPKPLPRKPNKTASISAPSTPIYEPKKAEIAARKPATGAVDPNLPLEEIVRRASMEVRRPASSVQEEVKRMTNEQLAKELVAGPNQKTSAKQERYRAVIDELTDRATSAGVAVGELIGGKAGRFAGGHLTGLGAGVVLNPAETGLSLGKMSAGGTPDLRDTLNIAGAGVDAIGYGKGLQVAAKAAAKKGSRAIPPKARIPEFDIDNPQPGLDVMPGATFRKATPGREKLTNAQREAMDANGSTGDFMIDAQRTIDQLNAQRQAQAGTAEPNVTNVTTKPKRPLGELTLDELEKMREDTRAWERGGAGDPKTILGPERYRGWKAADEAGTQQQFLTPGEFDAIYMQSGPHGYTLDEIDKVIGDAGLLENTMTPREMGFWLRNKLMRPDQNADVIQYAVNKIKREGWDPEEVINAAEEAFGMINPGLANDAADIFAKIRANAKGDVPQSMPSLPATTGSVLDEVLPDANRAIRRELDEDVTPDRLRRVMRQQPKEEQMNVMDVLLNDMLERADDEVKLNAAVANFVRHLDAVDPDVAKAAAQAKREDADIWVKQLGELNADPALAQKILDHADGKAGEMPPQEARNGSNPQGGATLKVMQSEARRIAEDRAPFWQQRAAQGGELGPNGEFYKGGQFIARFPETIKGAGRKVQKAGESANKANRTPKGVTEHRAPGGGTYSKPSDNSAWYGGYIEDAGLRLHPGSGKPWTEAEITQASQSINDWNRLVDLANQGDQGVTWHPTRKSEGLMLVDLSVNPRFATSTDIARYIADGEPVPDHLRQIAKTVLPEIDIDEYHRLLAWSSERKTLAATQGAVRVPAKRGSTPPTSVLDEVPPVKADEVPPVEPPKADGFKPTRAYSYDKSEFPKPSKGKMDAAQGGSFVGSGGESLEDAVKRHGYTVAQKGEEIIIAPTAYGWKPVSIESARTTGRYVTISPTSDGKIRVVEFKSRIYDDIRKADDAREFEAINTVASIKKAFRDGEMPWADADDIYGIEVGNKGTVKFLGEEYNPQDAERMVREHYGQSVPESMDPPVNSPEIPDSSATPLAEPPVPPVTPDAPKADASTAPRDAATVRAELEALKAKRGAKGGVKPPNKRRGAAYIPDAEDWADAAKAAKLHIELGARTFAEFSKRMIADLGDWVKPRLRELWEANNFDLEPEGKPIPEKRGPFERAMGHIDGIFSTMREGVATGDISFSGIQGSLVALTDTKAWGKGTKASIKSYRLKNYEDVIKEIKADPDFDLVASTGVELPAISGHSEELFQQSALQKVPIIGKGVKAAQQSYDGGATMTRYMVAKSHVKLAEALNGGPLDDAALKQIGSAVNSMTGRAQSNFGKLVGNLDVGRGIFAPSYWVSLFEAGYLRPLWTAIDVGKTTGNWGPAKLYARKYARVYAAGTAALLASKLAIESATDYTVEIDPRSNLFGKAYKIKNDQVVSIDMLPPQVSQPMKLLFQSMLGKKDLAGDVDTSSYARVFNTGNLLEGKSAPGIKMGFNIRDSVHVTNEAAKKGETPDKGDYPFGKNMDPRQAEGLKNLGIGSLPITFQSGKEMYETDALSPAEKLILLPFVVFGRGPNVYPLTETMKKKLNPKGGKTVEDILGKGKGGKTVKDILDGPKKNRTVKDILGP